MKLPRHLPFAEPSTVASNYKCLNGDGRRFNDETVLGFRKHIGKNYPSCRQQFIEFFSKRGVVNEYHI